jgi:hypothetical protein
VPALFSIGLTPIGSGDRHLRPAWATRQPIGLARRFLPGTGHRPPAVGRNRALSGLRSLRHAPLRATFVVSTFAIKVITAAGVAMGHHSVTMLIGNTQFN